MEEQYIHYQECINCLNTAWRTVCELENNKPGNALWAAAYRMALVEYCKPFKRSQGLNKQPLKIENLSFDSEFKRLHEEIISLRDTVLAHCDLGPLDAKLVYGSSDSPMIVMNSTPNLPKPSDIRQLIEFVLDELYRKKSEYIPG